MTQRHKLIPQFSIRTLLVVMVLAGIGASIFPFFMQPQPPDISDLEDSDLVVLKKLRRRGLNIRTGHGCALGLEATIRIRRCSDRKYHVTTFYLKHRDPGVYIDDIALFPELEEIIIGDVGSSKEFSICDRSRFNRRALCELIDKNFHQFANYPLSAIGDQSKNVAAEPKDRDK